MAFFELAVFGVVSHGIRLRAATELASLGGDGAIAGAARSTAAMERREVVEAGSARGAPSGSTRSG